MVLLKDVGHAIFGDSDLLLSGTDSIAHIGGGVREGIEHNWRRFGKCSSGVMNKTK